MSTSFRAQEFCKRALTDRDSFWTEQSKAIHWEKPFDQVCDFSRPPFARWFVGGKTNLCYNAVDRHLAARAAQPALYYISTEVETERTFTFQEVYDEVNTFTAGGVAAKRRPNWWGEAPEQLYDFNEAAGLLRTRRFGYTNLLAEPRSIG